MTLPSGRPIALCRNILRIESPFVSVGGHLMTDINTLQNATGGEPRADGIAGLAEWFGAQSYDAQDALRALGDLLNNVPSKPKEEEAFERFLERALRMRIGALVKESHELSGISRVMAGLALAEMITEHDPEIGPARFRPEPPKWDTATIGSDTYHFPTELAFYTDKASPGVDTVVVIQPGNRFAGGATLAVYVRPNDQEQGHALLQTILARAEELNIFRGRVLQATVESHGLRLEPILLASTTRDDVIAADDVWAEIDLNLRAVGTHSAMMKRLALGVRRGVLLAGPPGVGKSAIASVVANEVVGEFTVVYCDARAGTTTLREVFDECVRLGPCVVVIEDVDLIVRRRSDGFGGYALSEFLAALDSHPSAPLLVLATTNDVATLDAAAVRAARFDAIIEVPYPSTAVIEQILGALLRGVPGSEVVDISAVAAALPRNTSGADVREVVRRAVLTSSRVSTTALLAQVSNGRYRPTVPEVGTYI